MQRVRIALAYRESIRMAPQCMRSALFEAVDVIELKPPLPSNVKQEIYGFRQQGKEIIFHGSDPISFFDASYWRNLADALQSNSIYHFSTHMSYPYLKYFDYFREGPTAKDKLLSLDEMISRTNEHILPFNQLGIHVSLENHPGQLVPHDVSSPEFIKNGFLRLKGSPGFLFDIPHFMIMCFNLASEQTQKDYSKLDEENRNSLMYRIFLERYEELAQSFDVQDKITEIHLSHPSFTIEYKDKTWNPFKYGMLEDRHEKTTELEYSILRYLLIQKHLRPQYVTLEDYSDYQTLLASIKMLRSIIDSCSSSQK